MNLKSNWLKLAFGCLLITWLPASAAAQPLIYVTSEVIQPTLQRRFQLTVINSATGHVVKTMNLGEGPTSTLGPRFQSDFPAFVVAPDGSRVYVPIGRDIVIVDAATYTTQRVEFGFAVGEIALSEDGAKLYVGSTSLQAAFVLDTATRQYSGPPIPLPGASRQLGLRVHGTRLYLLGEDTVYVADIVTRAVVATFNARPSAVEMVVHPDGSRLYVANATRTTTSPDGNSITVYDTATLAEIKTTIFPDARIFTGSFLSSAFIGPMAILPAGNRLYVPLLAGFSTSPTDFFRRDVVHVVDSTSLEVINSITPLQTAPTAAGGIAATVAPDATTVFVGASGGVTAIDVATNAVTAAGPGVAGGTQLSAAPAPPCWFELSPQQSYVRAPGGTVVLNVPAPAGCGWTATIDGGWIAPSATSGTGPTTIALQVGSSDTPRSGTVTVAGQTVRIDQVISRVMIDTPGNGAELTLPLDLAGWAIEQDAQVPLRSDSGVALAHLYDYPAGGAPVFLQGIGTGITRSDIAAAFGERYRESGFSKRIGRLAAGAHTLVVYGLSRNDGQFVGTAVNVTVRRNPVIVIDAPASGATVSQPFTLFGWAADLTVPTGNGVDMVRLSAVRVDGTVIPLGSANYGASRADVSAYFANEASDPGFEMTVSGLPAGTYTLIAEARYTATGSFEKSASVQVTIRGTAPFGVIDTPASGALVAGTVAVTGWALSSDGVARVAIYRDPIGGETAQVWIGDATFVEGARPDVAAAFPGYPQNARAGWGLAVLSNLLPNRGDGPITFHAYAYDTNNNMTALGSRSVIGTNHSSVEPFGTIDTPGQGEIVSGVIRNWGWALTPSPAMIPFDGSTIAVFIDGVFVGRPVFGLSRPDIAALFPGYANTNAATGYFDFDTRTLANGVHTIYWIVYDNSGAGQGIGSRFFTINNQ